MIRMKFDTEIFDIAVIRYPDGTRKMDLPNIPDNTPFAELIWQFENEDELLTLLYIAGALRDNFPEMPVELYMPYLPNARMDRVHSAAEVFTLKHFARLINSADFRRVTMLDVHSNVGAALIDRAVDLSPAPYISQAREMMGFDPENDFLFFPDEGSFKRYSAIFPDCKNRGFGIKRRDWETGKILGLDIAGDDPMGKRVLMVDDICSYGGTAYHSAGKLKALGCGDISVFFTHCENSVTQGELLKTDLISRIFTTDSICTVNHPKLTVFDCLKGEK